MTGSIKFTRLEAAADINIGQVRSANQDSAQAWVLNREDQPSLAVLVLADGMGGHKDGGVASKIAVETGSNLLIKWLESLENNSPTQEEIEKHVTDALEQANLAIYQYSVDEGIKQGNIGTTMECAVVIGNRAYFGHVGDSRIYAQGRNGLELLTIDHSAVSELVQVGMLDPEDIYTHPNRNILTRGLGDGNELEVDFVERELLIGDRLMLCSDGLWGIVRDPVIEKLLMQAGRPAELVDNLIFAANEAGGDDNISAIVCEVFPA